MRSPANLARYGQGFVPALVALIGLVVIFFTPVEVPDLAATQSWDQWAVTAEVFTIQQTFVAEQPGLSRIEIALADRPGEAPLMPVRVELAAAGDVSWRTVAGATISAAAQRQPWFSFAFPPQLDSQGRTYLLSLKTASPEENMAAVRLSDADRYPAGSLRVDGAEQQGDLAFKAFHRVRAGALLQATAQRSISSIQLLLATLTVFVLPGFALMTLLGAGRGGPLVANPDSSPLDGAQQLALWITLSISAWVVPHVLVQLLGGSFPPLAAGVATVLWLVLAALAVWRWVRGRPPKPTTGPAKRPGDVAFQVTFVFFMLWVVTVRLAQIQPIATPAWIDSVEHAQRIQALVETGRTAEQFYHYAYHFLVVDLMALGGATLPESMLIVGQIISALIPLAIYALARYLFANRWAALAAAVAAGLISIMPAYYVAWGRYPLSLGWLLFPGTVMLVLASLAGTKRSLRLMALAGLAISGLLLAHTRMALLLVLLVGVVVAERMAVQRDLAQLRAMAWRVPLIGAVPLLLMGLWVFHFRGQGAAGLALADRALQRCLDPIGLVNRVAEVINLWPAYVYYGLGGLGLAWAALRGNRYATAVLAWVALLVLGANLPPGTPGCGFLTNDLVAIGLFLPAALGWAAGLSEVNQWMAAHSLHTRTRNLAWLAASGLIIVALSGGVGMLSILNPDTLLIRPADPPAIAWVRDHIPPQARFVVNSYRWFPHRYQVSDAGAWLPFVAQRPVDYALSLRVGEGVASGELDADALCEELRDERVSHVYLGQRGGAITTDFLRQNPSCFRPVYDEQGVLIAEIVE